MSTLLWADEFTTLDLASSTNPNGAWRPNDTWQPITKGYLDFGAGPSSYNCSPEESLGGIKYNPFAVAAAGVLTIKTIRTPASAKTAAGNAPWLTGILISNSNVRSFSYGYFEIRMALTEWCQGGFPALWFYAATGSTGNAAATNKGGAEIDLAEVFGVAAGNPTNITLHSAGNNNGPSQIGDLSVASVPGDTFGWHTYGMDWQPTYLRFYKDGLLVGSATPAYAAWLAGLQMDIRLNVAMDATWFPAGQMSQPAGEGVTMSVDYVHHYDTMPSVVSPTPVVTPTPVPVPVATGLSAASAAAGQSVTITGSGFGAAQGSGYVSFISGNVYWGAPGDQATFTITSWSDSAITFLVPYPSGTVADGWVVVPGQIAVVSVLTAGGSTSAGTLTIATPTPIAPPAPTATVSGTTVTVTTYGQPVTINVT